jgi:hypothetical protein
MVIDIGQIHSPATFSEFSEPERWDLYHTFLLFGDYLKNITLSCFSVILVILETRPSPSVLSSQILFLNPLASREYWIWKRIQQ